MIWTFFPWSITSSNQHLATQFYLQTNQLLSDNGGEVCAAKKQYFYSRFLLLKLVIMSLRDSPAQLSAEIEAKDILPRALFLFLHQFACMDLTLDLTSVIKKNIRISWGKGWPQSTKLPYIETSTNWRNQSVTNVGRFWCETHIVKLPLELVQVKKSISHKHCNPDLINMLSGGTVHLNTLISFHLDLTQPGEMR